MPKDMLGIAIRKLVTLPADVLGSVCDLLEKLADPEWVNAFKWFLRKENPWPTVEKAKQTLLKLIATVATPAIETFSAKDKFKIGEIDGVKIGWLGDNFQRVFGGKVEKSVAEATLRIHKLLKSSVDGLILAELGDIAETTLAQMWEMLKRQGRGQQGDLLVNGWANIFYIKDDAGNFWAVGCYWGSRYGYGVVEACPVFDPVRWGGGSQVVSR